MIDYRIDDFEQLKKIFIDCMNKYSYILKWPQNTIIERISIDTLYPPKDINENSIKNHILSLIKETVDISNTSEQGIILDGTKLIIYEHHFCMLSKLESNVPNYYQEIFRVLRFYGLVNSKLKLDRNQIEKLLKYSVYLYILPCYKRLTSHLDERWFEQLKKAKEHFSNIPYTIGIGELVYTTNAHKLIQLHIEKKIRTLGGINFLNLCKEILLKPSYNKFMDRFQITRHKNSYTKPDSPLLDSSIPVNYLIQLGLKNIEESSSHIINHNEITHIFHEICLDATAYMHLLNISSNNIYEELMLQIPDIPRYISCNLIYELLLTPDQYSTEYLLTIIKNVFIPIASSESIELGNWVQKYYIIAKKILYSSKDQFSATQLKRWTGLRNDEFNDILSIIIINSLDVNANFEFVGTEPNAPLHPVIRLSNGSLYIFDARLSAYGFYCCIHNYLKNKICNFNKKLGDNMEIFIRNLLNNNGWKVKNGTYHTTKKESQECDGFIEDDETIVGLEMKYCRFTKDYPTGNDIALFDVLGRGMLKAFKQNLQHWYDLINSQKLKLNVLDMPNTYELSWQSRRLISVSICSSEYRFLTSHTLVHKLLISLIQCSFGTYSPERVNELSNLLKTQKQVQIIIQKLSKNNSNTIIDKILFDTLFLSAPEIYYMCKSNKRNFIKQLIHLLHVTTGTMDTYTDLTLLSQ